MCIFLYKDFVYNVFTVTVSIFNEPLERGKDIWIALEESI